MADIDALDSVAARLTKAVETLEVTIEKYIKELERREHLKSEIAQLIEERDHLQAELRDAHQRAGKLETTNAEVANRLDSAIDSIKSVLGAT